MPSSFSNARQYGKFVVTQLHAVYESSRNRRSRKPAMTDRMRAEALKEVVQNEELAFRRKTHGNYNTPLWTGNYYHVKLDTVGYENDLLPGVSGSSSSEHRDLTKEEVIFRYILPYLQGEMIFIQGSVIAAPTAKQSRVLHVYRTVETAKEFCDRHEAKHPELAVRLRINNIALACDDILEDLVFEAQKLRYGIDRMRSR